MGSTTYYFTLIGLAINEHNAFHEVRIDFQAPYLPENSTENIMEFVRWANTTPFLDKGLTVVDILGYVIGDVEINLELKGYNGEERDAVSSLSI